MVAVLLVVVFGCLGVDDDDVVGVGVACVDDEVLVDRLFYEEWYWRRGGRSRSNDRLGGGGQWERVGCLGAGEDHVDVGIGEMGSGDGGVWD